jgi:hypothetical protein
VLDVWSLRKVKAREKVNSSSSSGSSGSSNNGSGARPSKTVKVPAIGVQSRARSALITLKYLSRGKENLQTTSSRGGLGRGEGVKG